ncbi:hypothetical protein MTR67_052093 [Solanum verrucosum]|uniref:Uncharacterized protein n=1 Tax=Solanum verrucosum TaxID=315347 RepID=A0AAF0V8N2_SOLVR|nr:hypothetical protein MTR67_052093 [Solanum verrucosum]
MFVEGLSSMPSPLTALTQKKAMFLWSEACEKSFQELKHKLTSDLVVALQEGSKSSFVEEVKAKKGLNLILIELKEVVPENSIEALSQGGDGMLQYQDVRNLQAVYWWNGMKKDIVEFVAKCPNFPQVKVEHQKTAGLFHDISFSTWKWEDLNMDFTVGLPRTRRQHDLIWVIVDLMTKLAHLIPIKKSFQKGFGTRIELSMAFHPQTDGQAERTIKTLEDMLKACVIDIKGPELVHEAMEQVLCIRERLKVTQSRQKSYADDRREILNLRWMIGSI